MVSNDWIHHLIDAAGVKPMVSIPIADNLGLVSWQRLAP
jgi:hypothetical protein